MTDPDCALCQLAATPIAERPTKTFYRQNWQEDNWIEVVRDTDADGAPGRLLCYNTRHISPTTKSPMMPMITRDMREALAGIANAEFGEGNWDFEVTMESCPEHGWHCHARKKEPQ